MNGKRRKIFPWTKFQHLLFLNAQIQKEKPAKFDLQRDMLQAQLTEQRLKGLKFSESLFFIDYSLFTL